MLPSPLDLQAARLERMTVISNIQYSNSEVGKQQRWYLRIAEFQWNCLRQICILTLRLKSWPLMTSQHSECVLTPPGTPLGALQAAGGFVGANRSGVPAPKESRFSLVSFC